MSGGILTHERLCSVLKYDPETGIWTWIARPNLRSTVYPGDIAGCANERYFRIQLDGVTYLAHRLAWFYMTGEWPVPTCDHEDRDGFNNKWSNLRLATNQQNGANRGVFSNNTSGLKGVHWAKTEQRWNAQIKIDQRSRNLGYFECPAAAHFAYLIAADSAFGSFARGG